MNGFIKTIYPYLREAKEKKELYDRTTVKRTWKEKLINFSIDCVLWIVILSVIFFGLVGLACVITWIFKFFN